MFSKAFTLIELLIVVAIIAILAAIAVPNFLEAQTRAKVSRVKSDFRTMATSIETYALDKNGRYDITRWQRWVTYAFRGITTPIAYMNSIPRDPFIPPAVAGYQIPSEPTQSPSAVYLWYDTAITAGDDKMTAYMDPGNPNHEGFKQAVGNLHNKQWFLVSQGPKTRVASNGISTIRDLHTNNLWALGPYDATNGTLSFGLIVSHN